MNWLAVGLLVCSAIAGVAVFVVPHLRIRSPSSLAAWLVATAAGSLGMWQIAWPQSPWFVWLAIGVVAGIGNFYIYTDSRQRS